jgi:hypothetical protein
MLACDTCLTLYLSRAAPGSDLRHFARDLSRIVGVVHVAPVTRFGRLLQVAYNANLLDAATLLEWARSRWGKVDLFWHSSAA